MNEIQVFDGDGTRSTKPLLGETPRALEIMEAVGDPMTPMVTPMGRHVRYPFATPRPGQLEAIDAITEVLETGANALFCASTGFGKSPAMVGLATIFKSAWLIVGRNDLVEQWRGDFSKFAGVGFMKARRLFPCVLLDGEPNVHGEPYTCDSGNIRCDTMRKEACTAAKNGVPNTLVGCPYIENRDQALMKPYTVMTAAMAMTLFTYLSGHELVQKRDLLVVDECSELESELIKFFEVTLRSKWVCDLFPHECLKDILETDDDLFKKKVDPSTSIRKFIDSIKPANLDQAMFWLDTVSRMISIKEEWLTEDDDREHKEISAFQHRLQMAKKGISMDVPFHFELEQVGGDYVVSVTPLEARGLFDEILGSMAEHCVFTSATTGTAELFRRTHAMTKDVRYVEGGSPFPPAHRPIIFQQLGNLSRKSFDRDIKGLADGIVRLAMTDAPGKSNDHMRQKGLIHTYNSRVLDAIQAAFDRAGQGHRLVKLQGGGKQRNDIVTYFKGSKHPLILISPSAMLGLSLDDDKGRWQVIAKTPYAFLGDPSVEHRKNEIPDWYSWQTTKDIIQACGRIVRSPTDWGITYIVDEAFQSHLRWNRDQFPRYILDALHGV